MAGCGCGPGAKGPPDVKEALRGAFHTQGMLTPPVAPVAFGWGKGGITLDYTRTLR